MEKMTFSDRLNLAMKKCGFTQASLADAVGMAQPSVWKLTSGKASSSRKIVQIANVLGVRPEWLSSGEGIMSNENIEVSIPKIPRKNIFRVEVLDIQASAGPGSITSSDFIETIRAIEYTTDQAVALFGHRSAKSVKVITVRGDSMEGTINSGDEIFVDAGVNQFDGDGVYVFVFGSTLHVKRLQMQRDKLAVISDNQKYERWYIEDGDEDKFYIAAKVLLRQSIDYKRFC